MKKLDRTFILLSLMGFLLTSLTVFLGAPVLRVLWSRSGSALYWLTGLALSPLFYQYEGYLAGSVWVLIGLYSELESKGVRWIWSGLLSLIAGFILFAGGSLYELRKQGITNYSQFAENTKSQLEKATPGGLPPKESIEAVIQNMPAIAFVSLILVLVFGLSFERTVYRVFRVPRERFVGQIRFLEFKMPDIFVWVAMFSFLGSFQEWPGKIISTNIVIVCGFLFLLQGVAILETFFNVIRASWFVRGLGYFLFVFQLFVALAFIGFIDFWIDFRDRFRKMKSKAQTTGM
jgi:hypothetical protein